MKNNRRLTVNIGICFMLLALTFFLYKEDSHANNPQWSGGDWGGLQEYYERFQILGNVFSSYFNCTTEECLVSRYEYRYFLKVADIATRYRNRYNVELDWVLLNSTIMYNDRTEEENMKLNLHDYDLNAVMDFDTLMNLDWNYTYHHIEDYQWLDPDDGRFDLQILAKHMVTKTTVQTCTRRRDDGSIETVLEETKKNTEDIYFEPSLRKFYLECPAGTTYNIVHTYDLDLYRYDTFLLAYIECKYYVFDDPEACEDRRGDYDGSLGKWPRTGEPPPGGGGGGTPGLPGGPGGGGGHGPINTGPLPSVGLQELMNLSDAEAWRLLTNGVITSRPSSSRPSNYAAIQRGIRTTGVTIPVRRWVGSSGLQRTSSTTTIYVNAHLAEFWLAFFTDLHNLVPNFVVREVGCLREPRWDSLGLRSSHPYGAACDINWSTRGNGWSSPKSTRLGVREYTREEWMLLPEERFKYETIYRDSPMEEIGRKYTLNWGGRWSCCGDAMHFSFIGDGATRESLRRR